MRTLKFGAVLKQLGRDGWDKMFKGHWRAISIGSQRLPNIHVNEGDMVKFCAQYWRKGEALSDSHSEIWRVESIEEEFPGRGWWRIRWRRVS